VRDKFRTTDIRKYRRMLQNAFYTLMEYIAMGSAECQTYLEGIAATHGKQGHDIAPHLYDLWLECLLRTVKACDDLYSPEVEGAWRHMMGPGVMFLKSRYGGPVTDREVSD
jgi:hemoglobin-like flavoprotein